MNKNPWTPGPWTHNRGYDQGGAPTLRAVGWPGRMRDVCRVLYDGGSEDPEVHANARLIAAAPEMAELLERIVEHGTTPKGTFALEARALLARIKGETA